MSATMANGEATLASLISALQRSFGDRACAVAERQVEEATQGALDTWTVILDKLRWDRDHQR